MTTDAAGHLATANFSPQDITNLNSALGNLNANVTGLWQNVAALNQSIQRGYEGTAIAIALAGTALPSDKNYAISGNWGTFRGQNAFGGSAQIRRKRSSRAERRSLGVGFQKGGVGGRAGATVAW